MCKTSKKNVSRKSSCIFIFISIMILLYFVNSPHAFGYNKKECEAEGLFWFPGAGTNGWCLYTPQQCDAIGGKWEGFGYRDFGSCTFELIWEPSEPGTGCDEEALGANLRWFNSDAAKNNQSAYVRGMILRFANLGSTETIRKYYKQGQQHDRSAYELIDQCADWQVLDQAWLAAEAGRLQNCGDPSPANSADCTSGLENLRWSMLEAQSCSGYSRYFIRLGMKKEFLKEKAQWIRNGVKVAQGHNLTVLDSVDYIGDRLLVSLAEKALTYVSAQLSSKQPDYSNPFAIQSCPGLKYVQDVINGQPSDELVYR